jgi:YVTN family beta-propeller protein
MVAGTLAPGQTFAGYRIEGVVGRGGMGVVYRAWDLALERPVALKLVAPELAADPRFRERFLRESRLAAAIEHPHILPVHAAGEADGTLFLVTRFVEGEDLKTRLDRDGPMDPAVAVALVTQIGSALDAAHAKGLVHRDVKPGNVLISSSGECYLCDFGLTKPMAAERSLTESGQFVGTLDYVAPEQIRGPDVDGRADQYALACVFYECLAGSPPFRESSGMAVMWAHMQEEPAPLRERRPELPEAIDVVIDQALAKEPEERYDDCSELAEAAREALGLGIEVRRAPLLPAWFRRHARLIAAIGALLVAGAVAAAVVQLTRGSSSEGIEVVAGNAVGVIDPSSNRITAQIPVGRSPTNVEVGEGAAWVINADDQTITRIDSDTLEAGQPFAVGGGTPIDLAVGDGALWVASGTPDPNAQFGGPVLNALVRIDPDTSGTRAVVEVPHDGPTVVSTSQQRLVAAAGSLWVVLASGGVARVDMTTGEIVATVEGVGAFAIASDGDSIWTLETDGSLKRINPSTNGITANISLQTTGLDSIAVGGGDVWATSSADGVVWRITVAPRPVSRTIQLETGAAAVSYHEGSVWVANGVRGTVSRIDPATNAVVATVAVGNTPYGLAVDDAGVWVTVQGGGEAAAASTVEGIEAMPSSFCGSPVYGGEGTPDLLVVSDLPLQGGSRFTTVQMEQAIEYVFRQRGFQAGEHRVAYQSCDDSLASTGLFDFDKCAANAKAYAQNAQVVAVIGTHNSACAAAEIPVLNEAAGGPLAMISPSNSLPSLTRQSLDAPPNGMEILYPTGTRNYVRVYSTDDMQAAALVTFARDELGARDVVIVNDGEDAYGEIVAAYLRRAAANAGLDVVGTAGWDPQAATYDELAEDAAAARPDAVFVSGLLDTNGAVVVAAIRAAVGPDTPILVPDGFTPLSLFLDQAGDSAKGVYLSAVGLPTLEQAAATEALPDAAVRFVEDFGATQPAGVDTFAVYAAQAAEVLLDAVARSDGSRAGVVEQLFATKVDDGILGSFTFDANGDISLNPVSIYRVEEGGGGNEIASVEGGTLVDVVTPDPSLVRQ